MRVKDLYELLDSQVIMSDEEGHEYTYDECRFMEVIQVRAMEDYIVLIIDKYSAWD